MTDKLEWIEDFLQENPVANLYVVADEEGGGFTAHLQTYGGRELASDMAITIVGALDSLDDKLGEGGRPS